VVRVFRRHAARRAVGGSLAAARPGDPQGRLAGAQRRARVWIGDSGGVVGAVLSGGANVKRHANALGATHSRQVHRTVRSPVKRVACCDLPFAICDLLFVICDL
jgi:hypothetical protein